MFHIKWWQILNTSILMVSCQKGPTRHAYAWQIGPFWQDTLDLSVLLSLVVFCVTSVLSPQNALRTQQNNLHKHSTGVEIGLLDKPQGGLVYGFSCCVDISFSLHYIPDSKVHGANMGPIWGGQDPGGPMLAPWTLLSGIPYYIFDKLNHINLSLLIDHIGCLHGVMMMRMLKYTTCATV